MSGKRRIVITGVGIVSPVGIGSEKTWDSLINGKSGIDYLENTHRIQNPVKLGGAVKDFDLNNFYSDPKKIRSMGKDMDRVSQFAVVASNEAVKDAGLDKANYDKTRIATFVGTGIGGIDTTCEDTITLYEKGPKAVGLRSIIRLMPNAPSGYIAIEHGFQGRAKSDATACASGLDSIFDAYWYLQNNLADVMITGGTEATLTPLALISFNNMTALSKRDCEPHEASCPFDKRRDGFVMSEGAVVLVLEEITAAKSRGAKIYAEIVGVGASCDAYHITAPTEDGSGGARAMEAALLEAGLSESKEKIDYIHAHGTSTPLNDARETLGIKRVFGEHAYKLCVSSTKSMTGHLIGAAGPMGVFSAAMSCSKNIIAPTINYKEPDPVCDLDYVPNEAREKTVNYALVQALGFGGHNTAVVLKKAE
jgi:3-oxoacyl-[acyl-carrier-protein] synthase II